MPVSIETIAEPMMLMTTSHINEDFSARTPYYYRYDSTDEQTIVADFRRALQRLEGFVYAVLGAMPASYKENKQYWLHPNPRCLFPEQIFFDTSSSKTGGGPGYRDWWWQLSALGTRGSYSRGLSTAIGDLGATGYFDWSRSDTVANAYARTSHTREFFPRGSVTRTAVGEYDDPAPGETVTIAWAVPAAVAGRVAGATLWYDAGSGLTSVGMSLSSGTYSATIPGQVEGTTVKFYIAVSSTSPSETLYEPYGASKNSAPEMDGIHADVSTPGDGHMLQADGSSYYYYVMTHKHPYARGLPELLWETFSSEDPRRTGLKRCTGTWLFNNLSSIPVHLINVARFTLDFIGANFHHSPRTRPSQYACCHNAPIVWRWSGSHRPWLFQTDGKVGHLPIHNFSSSEEVSLARFTWRGLPNEYLVNAAVFSGINARPYRYADNESWRSWPVYSWFQWISPEDDEWGIGAMVKHGEDRGLRQGDQIDLIHLVEIIEAVDYICDNSVWFPKPVDTCKRTCTIVPDGYPSIGQKRVRTITVVDDEVTADSTGIDPSTLPGGPACVRAYVDEYDQPQTAPWDEPTVAECNASTPCTPSSESRHVAPGMSTLFAERRTHAFGIEISSVWYVDIDVEHVAVCLDNFQFCQGHVYLDCWAAYTLDMVDGTYGGWARGPCYYSCPPKQSYGAPGDQYYTGGEPMWDGIDTDHGNGFSKSRSLGGAGNADHEVSKPDQYAASMGNCAYEALACDLDEEAGYKQARFDEVLPVGFYGPTPEWAADEGYTEDPLSLLGRCVTSSDWVSEDELPLIAGGNWSPLLPPDEDHPYWWKKNLCNEYSDVLLGAETDYFHGAYCSYNRRPDGDINEYDPKYCGCSGDGYVWLGVDLNMVNGTPTLREHDLSIKMKYPNGTLLSPAVYPDTVVAPSGFTGDTNEYTIESVLFILQDPGSGERPVPTDSFEDGIYRSMGGVQCPVGTRPDLDPIY